MGSDASHLGLYYGMARGESPGNTERLGSAFNRPFGTDDAGTSDPALKRWAIFNSPSGRRQAIRLCGSSIGSPSNRLTPHPSPLPVEGRGRGTAQRRWSLDILGRRWGKPRMARIARMKKCFGLGLRETLHPRRHGGTALLIRAIRAIRGFSFKIGSHGTMPDLASSAAMVFKA